MASKDSRIDTKLDYVLGTKSLIRQAMSNKGIEVTDDTTFRAYADLINNLKLEADQSDATAMANDIVAGKIAYNNNNKIIGIIPEVSSVSSEAVEVIDDISEEKIISSMQIDDRLLLSKNAKVNIEIPYNTIDSYNKALDLASDILGEKEDDEALEAYNLLNQVTATPQDEYQGKGSTTDEIMSILNEIMK